MTERKVVIKMDDPKKVAVDHLKTHVTYPATTEQVLEACGNWSDVDPALVEEGKAKLAAHAGMTWNSADELVAMMGWGEEAPAAGGDMSGGMPPAGGMPAA